jgi:hypothetical protein
MRTLDNLISVSSNETRALTTKSSLKPANAQVIRYLLNQESAKLSNKPFGMSFTSTEEAPTGMKFCAAI